MSRSNDAQNRPSTPRDLFFFGGAHDERQTTRWKSNNGAQRFAAVLSSRRTCLPCCITSFVAIALLLSTLLHYGTNYICRLYGFSSEEGGSLWPENLLDVGRVAAVLVLRLLTLALARSLARPLSFMGPRQTPKIHHPPRSSGQRTYYVRMH